MDDLPVVAAGCELVLESLVARKKIARSDTGTYGRAVEEKRRRLTRTDNWRSSQSRRLYGSGGSEVAAIVAKTLGWSLLDNAVVDAVATRMGLSVAEVQIGEEECHRYRAADIGNGDGLAGVDVAHCDAKRSDRRAVIEVTRHIIEEAIARGPLVVVAVVRRRCWREREDALTCSATLRERR